MTTTEELNEGAAYWLRQFQLQQDAKDNLQLRVTKLSSELESTRAAIAEAMALHRESKFMQTVSYCELCTERWPCKSVVILARIDDISGEAVQKRRQADE